MLKRVSSLLILTLITTGCTSLSTQSTKQSPPETTAKTTESKKVKAEKPTNPTPAKPQPQKPKKPKPQPKKKSTEKKSAEKVGKSDSTVNKTESEPEQEKKESKEPKSAETVPETSTEKQSNPANNIPQSPDNSTISQYEQEVINRVNMERKKKGLNPLQASTKLSHVAGKKSSDMRDKNYFDHHSPTYGSPFEMLKTFEVSYRSAGENIAAGQGTPKQVVEGWMNSPGHRANILNNTYTHIGVGYVKGGSYGTYWTQLFIGK